MSADKLSLKVNARDGTAEITVYDGSFKQVGRGVGSLDVLLRKGIYEVRARVGGAVETQLVSPRPERPGRALRSC